ncbi:MAG: hypothetical protein GXO43_05990 [Crenarchaeota archaeon]|nr:hypothetical protein [Thermoproteota archaeon]
MQAPPNQYIEIGARWTKTQDKIRLLKAPENGEATIRIIEAISNTGYRTSLGGGTLAPGDIIPINLQGDHGTITLLAAFNKPGAYLLEVGAQKIPINITAKENKNNPKLIHYWVYPLNTGLVVILQYSQSKPGIPATIMLHVRDHDTGKTKTLELTRRTIRDGSIRVKIPAAQLAPSPHPGPNKLDIILTVNGKTLWRGHDKVWLGPTTKTTMKPQARKTAVQKPRPPSQPRLPHNIWFHTQIKIPKTRLKQATLLIPR